MRLTLRTLLAYLDGILEPNDSQDIGKKIEESEFATGLVHRIRDVMRRLRLGAPNLAERNPKLDPNSVAEYLDNTLNSEAVADFEKVCLESDVHLAEVAACHQILTLVLGEPAEIDPASRQRMYQLKDAPAIDEPPPIPAATATPPSPATSPNLDLDRGDGDFTERKPRPRPTVPEYLRESRRRRSWAPTMAVVLVVCLTVTVLAVLNQFEPGTPLGNILVRWGVVTPPQNVAAVPDKAQEQTLLTPTKEPAKEQEPVKGLVQDPAKEPIKQPAVTESKAPPKEPEKAVTEEPAVTPVDPPTADLKSPTAAPVVKLEPTVEPKTAVKPSVETAAIEPVTVKASDAGMPPAAEPAPLPRELMGRLMSSDQVLLKDDPAQGGWVRVAASQTLMPQRLLALPTYRAKVALTIGVTLEILGGTQIELLPGGPNELAGIRILFGRVVMMPVTKPGSQIRVAFGDRSGVITLVDPESVAAFDVRRVHVPGTNPEAGPPHIVANLYTSIGGVLWEEDGGREGRKSLQLTPPQWVTFNGPLTAMPPAPRELPKWIMSADSMTPLDRRASPQIAQGLQTDRLARLALMELGTARPQKEVKWLTLRCLGYLGQFRDMATALNDPARKLDWPEFIDQLREAVARDAESAAAVRMALEKQYPQQADDLYRMLWGYTDKDLEAGEDAKLVKGLEDETLAVRVLSYWNLKDLTGMGASYRPEQTPVRRQQPTLRWRQRLEANEIRLKTPEEKASASAEEAPAPPPAREESR